MQPTVRKWFAALIFIGSTLLVTAQFPGGTGYTMDDASYQSIPLDASMTRNLYAALPSSASLRSYCPTPGNQVTMEHVPLGHQRTPLVLFCGRVKTTLQAAVSMPTHFRPAFLTDW